MPDGSGRGPIEAEALAAEAERAAADAAREAKAEMIERETAAAPASPQAPTAKRAGKRAKAAWHEFTVDVWITSLNSIEFGFYKRSRNKAKSRQFTTDMDVFAEVIENGERTGVLGYREDLWKKSAGMDKRLVFKLFGERLNWKATMDLMIGRSLQLSFGAHGFPVIAFSVNVGDHDHVVYLERSAHKWPLLPENFSFFTMEAGRPVFYRLRRDFIDLGGDYTLYDEHDVKIGRLNGAVFSLGGKWKGRVRMEKADPRLLMVLKLFCGMLIFNKECRAHVRSLVRDIKRARLLPKLEKQEADLYMNPRRVR